jgi:hypothetical protein
MNAITSPTSASGPPTNATTSPTNATAMPTHATGPPAIPSSAVGGTRRQQGTSEAAPTVVADVVTFERWRALRAPSRRGACFLHAVAAPAAGW